MQLIETVVLKEVKQTYRLFRDVCFIDIRSVASLIVLQNVSTHSLELNLPSIPLVAAVGVFC